MPFYIYCNLLRVIPKGYFAPGKVLDALGKKFYQVWCPGYKGCRGQVRISPIGNGEETVYGGFCSIHSGAVTAIGRSGTSTPRWSARAVTSMDILPVSVQVPKLVPAEH